MLELKTWMLLSAFQLLLRRISGAYLKIESVPRQGFLSIFCAPVLTKKKKISCEGKAPHGIYSVGFF